MSATLALAADAAAAGPFDAQSTQYVETIRFRIADLHTPEGARRLARRIRNAAAYVCDGDDPVVRTSSGFETCRTASIRRAIGGVNAPLLAQALNIAPGDAHAGQVASAEARPD